jgi:uncharacterized protein (TIGR03435 family)
MFKGTVFALVSLIGFFCPAHAFAIPTLRPQQSAPLSFEVASIKPATPGDRGGKFAIMQGGHQFVVRNYKVKDLVSFAYNLPPRLISGGPAWSEVDAYNILAATPGEARPNLDEQMAMMRTLLADRFKLEFHTEPKETSVYALTVTKGGIKFNETAQPNIATQLVNTIFPAEKAHLPARNATMDQFASMLQRGVVDRPVVDKTNLTGKYDFDLEWTYDETQFGGNLPPIATPNDGKPDLFSALQQQLGLRLESSRAAVDTIVIDRVQKPSEN